MEMIIPSGAGTTLLYYVHPTTYNGINWNFPRVLVQFHTRRLLCASLSIRVSDSGHPVTYSRQFCTNNTGHKIYCWMSARSTLYHTILHYPTILHTKTIFASACHPHNIYPCMTAHSTGNDTFLHNNMILPTKKFFVPACHQRQKILSEKNCHSLYCYTHDRLTRHCPLQNTIQTHIRVKTFPFFII